MSDPMEIVVSIKGNPCPRTVEFSELYALRDSLASIMVFWNSNSYYVDSVSKTFIINGGRKVRFNEMEDCRILYRRRTRAEMAVNSGEEKSREVIWIFGIESMTTGSTVFVEVSEDGKNWQWNTKL